MKKIYLLTTAHLEDGLWFRDEEDFKVAMNYLAIQAACCPEVIVLAAAGARTSSTSSTSSNTATPSIIERNMA